MIWWLPLVMAVPLFFLWVAVHEGSHAIEVLFQRGRVIEFKPYPHKEAAGWMLGSMRYEGYLEDPISVHVSPYVTDAFATLFMALFFWPLSEGPWWDTIFLALFAAPLVDTVAGLIGRVRRNNESADLNKSVPAFTVWVFFFLAVGYAIHLTTAILRVLVW